MNYEEKYKNALERAKELCDVADTFTITIHDICTIFPELHEQESEDERIRKAIIAYISHDQHCGVSNADMIAWLEKQDAKKRIFNADDWYVSEVDGKIHNPKFIEKQGEKKPTDKVEPKFKIGDWVVNNVCFPMQIASIKDGMYIFTNGDAMSVLFIDGNFHLWTINDAKDGDVLIRETGEPFIHNGNHGSYIPEFLGAYCGISDGRFRPNGSPYYWGKPSCPATKEQRDLLFSKMKEEGYEWDANKKELKKMESKTLNADKVIEWLDKQACLGWLEDIEVEKVVEQFKKDFGL